MRMKMRMLSKGISLTSYWFGTAVIRFYSGVVKLLSTLCLYTCVLIQRYGPVKKGGDTENGIRNGEC